MPLSMGKPSSRSELLSDYSRSVCFLFAQLVRDLPQWLQHSVHAQPLSIAACAMDMHDGCRVYASQHTVPAPLSTTCQHMHNASLPV